MEKTRTQAAIKVMISWKSIAPKKDRILEIFETYKQDPRPNKVNLTIGLYMDECGRTKVFDAVRQAEKILAEQQLDKIYLPLRGPSSFLSTVTEYILGAKREDFIASYGCGGTGAIRLAAEVISASYNNSRIWIGYPTWENHTDIFQHTNFSIIAYPWLNKDYGIAFEEVLDKINKEGKEGDWFLLQACCHNPTGMDLRSEALQALFHLLLEKKMNPFFDIAYQGFSKSVEEDVAYVRKASAIFENIVLCYSFSKIMGIYNDRCGVLLMKTAPDYQERLRTQVEAMARLLFFTPPATGIQIVEHILNNVHLKALWLKELNEQRERLTTMRQTLVKLLGFDERVYHLIEANGLFALLDLLPEQINILRKQHGIYLLDNGRLNLAGLNSSNIDKVADALKQCL